MIFFSTTFSPRAGVTILSCSQIRRKWRDAQKVTHSSTSFCHPYSCHFYLHYGSWFKQPMQIFAKWRWHHPNPSEWNLLDSRVYNLSSLATRHLTRIWICLHRVTVRRMPVRIAAQRRKSPRMMATMILLMRKKIREKTISSTQHSWDVNLLSGPMTWRIF